MELRDLGGAGSPVRRSQLKYARPGLPAFSQEVLRKWKSEVKLQRKVKCPNQVEELRHTTIPFSVAVGGTGTTGAVSEQL